MTDTTGLDTLEAQRLELLRRKIAERGLARPDVAADAACAAHRRCPTVNAGCGSCSRSTRTARCSTSASPTASPATSTSQRLRQAVDAVALRHPVLRTTYQTGGDGEPHPVIHDDLRPDWAEHDLSGLAEQARQLRLEVLAQRQFRQPFDLTKDSPLRIAAARLGADELMLLFTAHHIAWDDGSWAPFFTDLVRAYTDADSLAPAPAVAGDPVRSRSEDLAYWRSLMTDLPEPLELPGASGSVVPSTWRAQRATARLSAETVDRAAALARETGATPYMVLMAAFGALVHRYTHASDFLVATPVLNRSAGTETAIGYFGNTLVMRMRPESRDDVPGPARADQGQRSRRPGSLARRPGMAGTRIQSRPPARRRANDARQLRITRARRWRLQSARGPVRARRAARPHQSIAARSDDRIGWPGPRRGGRSRIPGRSSRPSAGGATAAALRRAVGSRAREPGHHAVGVRTDERGGRRMAPRCLGR